MSIDRWRKILKFEMGKQNQLLLVCTKKSDNNNKEETVEGTLEREERDDILDGVIDTEFWIKVSLDISRKFS